jgi:hypothetical protein
MWLQEQMPKKHVFTRDWTVCSKYDYHSRFIWQYNWRNYSSVSIKIFDSIMDKIIHPSFTFYEESDNGLDLDLLSILY